MSVKIVSSFSAATDWSSVHYRVQQKPVTATNTRMNTYLLDDRSVKKTPQKVTKTKVKKHLKRLKQKYRRQSTQEQKEEKKKIYFQDPKLLELWNQVMNNRKGLVSRNQHWAESAISAETLLWPRIRFFILALLPSQQINWLDLLLLLNASCLSFFTKLPSFSLRVLLSV